MLQSTITAVRMLIAADPETDDATVERIVLACKTKPTERKDLINSRAAAAIIGVSRQTLHSYTKRGLVHPIHHSKRQVRFDRAEIESFAANGI